MKTKEKKKKGDEFLDLKKKPKSLVVVFFFKCVNYF